LNISCLYYTPTPYGPACGLQKEFLRTGDMVLCEGCSGYKTFTGEEVEPVNPETLTVEKLAVIARLSDGSVRQVRLTENQEAIVTGFIRGLVKNVECYHRILKGVNLT
jgi:hypothetical protein